MEQKNNNNECLSEKLNDEEQLDFLREEYNLCREKLQYYIDRSVTFLAWDAGVFSFIISFSNFFIINKHDCDMYICKINLLLKMVTTIGLIFLIVAGFFFVYNIKPKLANAFDYDDIYKREFNRKEISEDFYSILKDYDKVIAEVSRRFEIGIYLMMIGIVEIFLIVLLAKFIFN